jgi:malate permease and related proteins
VFWNAFKITAGGVGESFILGLIGYFLIKRNFLGEAGLNALSRLVIDVTLPLLIFSRLLKDFRFEQFPNWWVFPLISLAITLLGLLVGWLFSGFVQGSQHKLQFLSLVSFQNSGYLPLVLLASLLTPEKADVMFIYLFLFLLGFNLVMFSLGIYLLTFAKAKRFDWWSLLNPPVVATLAGLALVFFNLERFFPSFLMRPLQTAGDCTLPLATFVVGGNIAAIHLAKVEKKTMALMSLAKLVVMPALGLWLVFIFKLPELFGLLIVLQLAMPPATNLSVIVSHYKKDDLLVSQGIFFGHVVSLITIPLILSLYFMINMLK